MNLDKLILTEMFTKFSISWFFLFNEILNVVSWSDFYLFKTSIRAVSFLNNVHYIWVQDWGCSEIVNHDWIAKSYYIIKGLISGRTASLPSSIVMTSVCLGIRQLRQIEKERKKKAHKRFNPTDWIRYAQSSEQAERLPYCIEWCMTT